jgi:hypothetical protein
MPVDYNPKAREIPKEVLERLEGSRVDGAYGKAPHKGKDRNDKGMYMELGALLAKDPEKWMMKIHQDFGPLSVYDIKDMYGASRGRKVMGSDDAWFNFLKNVYGKSIKKRKLVRNESNCTELP